MNNEKIDISKLYNDNKTKHNNSLIFLNDYLKTLNKGIDINTDIMTFAKKFEYEKKFDDTYIQKKSIAPHWEIALENWIEDLENISNYNLAPFVYCNDISRGENKPLHNYIDFIVKPVYENNDFLSDSEIIGYQIIDEIVYSIVEGVICAMYLKDLTIELNKLHKKEEIIIEVAKDITPLKKQIDTINFTGATKRDLPYFFWQLQKLKLIEVDNLGLNLSKIFTYLNEPIDNTYFNAEFSKFEKGETPANAIEIDKILLKPKKNIIKLK